MEKRVLRIKNIRKQHFRIVGNIMDFKSDYPKARIIKLEQNYRSTQTILDAANAVIENNPDRPSKKLWTEQRGGAHLQWYTAMDEHNEA